MSSSPKRLAFVITELEVGGAERCLVNLASRIDRDRFEPIVYALAARPSPPRDALVRQLEDADVPVRFLGYAQKWRLPAAVHRLVSAWRENPPAVVQSMLFHANVVTGLAVRRLARCDTWCAGIRVADPSRSRQFVERGGLKRAFSVVCVSQRVADYATRRMKIPAEKLRVIPNGVDVASVCRHEVVELTTLGVPPSRRAITCVSRLTPQKGIDQLLEHAGPLLAALPNHDLLMVGDGSQAEALRRRAVDLGIGSRVHFCGWQPNVMGILLASDVMVLPSRWEGMPNVLLEAMACERPVVCTQAEGVLEVLGPLAQDQSVAVGDAQSFTKRVLSIVRQPVLAARLGRDNRRRVAAHFSLDGMVRRYEELYSTASLGSTGGKIPS